MQKERPKVGIGLLVFKKENQVIQRIAKQVLRVVKENIGKEVSVREKTAIRDVVSLLDTMVEKIIMEGISHEFRRDLILSEESSPDVSTSYAVGWIFLSLRATKGSKAISKNYSIS